MQPSMLVFVQRISFEDMTCSVAQCLDVVGEWWSLLIVRDAFLGVTRFDDFQARLGISRRQARRSDHPTTMPPRLPLRLVDLGRHASSVTPRKLFIDGQWTDAYAEVKTATTQL